MDSNTKITKQTKNKIRVDYEGKLSFKDRLLNKLKASNTWIKVVVNIFRFILMLGVSFVILFPFIAKIAGSFMTPTDIVDPTVAIIPKNFSLDIYKFMITENGYFEALLNTLLLSLVCALIQTLISCLIGYGLAKFKFKGNGLLFGLVILTMIIPHSAMTLSFIRHFTNFDLLVVQSFSGMKGILTFIAGGRALDLTNTFWPLIILSIFGLAFKNGLYIYLLRQFFKGVPDELEESAYVDGSGVFRTFFTIILPLAVPMMITVFIFAFSWQWTDSFYTMNLIKGGMTSSTDTMKLMPDLFYNMPQDATDLQNFFGAKIETSYIDIMQNTVAIIIILPLVIMYLFCQRYLVQGIERSGLVG